jgi:hypothetical protein
MSSELGAFVSQNPTKLGLFTRRVKFIDEADLVDVNLRWIDIVDSLDDNVTFDVIVDTKVAIAQRKASDDIKDEKKQWFRISCSADMENQAMSNFNLTRIEIYNKKSHSKTAVLSDKLVPIIAKENFDEVAEEFLKAYYPEALEKPGHVSV